KNHPAKMRFHRSKMCLGPIAVARLPAADKNPARSRTPHTRIQRICQESSVKQTKKTCLQLNVLLWVAVLVLHGCGGDGKKPSTTQPETDTTPAAFSFAAQSEVAPDTAIESAPVTISGINAPAPVSITGGEYSIDGAAYSGTPGTIRNNQQVRIRVQSASQPSGQVSASLTIGGISGS